MSERSAALRRALADAAPNNQLFAVIDGASVAGLPAQLLASGATHRCLYRLADGDPVAEVSPWLVALDSVAPLAEAALSGTLAPHWGIVVASALPTRELVRSLRGLTMVRNDQGKAVLFRFYDPRVFNRYLPQLGPAQAATFFKGVAAYATQVEDGAVALWSPGASGPQQRAVTFS